MRRTTAILGLLLCVAAPVRAQDKLVSSVARQPSPFARTSIHFGKWMTAAGAAGFTYLASREHSHSRDHWNDLLTICHSAQDACNTGSDGRYLRADAEQLYQTSRRFDRRANRWLLGAQASLFATAVLFILDLRTGSGPDNIPLSPLRVTVIPTPGGAEVGMQIAF